ncbi:MAG: hypothetical protein K2Q12_11305 [Rickettsiales bacterium]|nr:hypothetical protein [Rickettsiales bacterium]
MLLSQALSPHHVSISDSLVSVEWTPWPHFNFNASDINVLDPSQKHVAHFPVINADISFGDLLRGDFVLSQVRMEKAIIAIHVKENGAITLGFNEVAGPASSAQPVYSLNQLTLPIKGLIIHEARLIVMNGNLTEGFDVPLLSYSQQNHQHTLRVLQGTQPAPAELILRWAPATRDKHHQIMASIHHLPLHSALQLLPEEFPLQGFDMAINGQIEAEITKNGSLSNVNAELYGNNGTYYNKNILPENIPVSTFKVGVSGQNNAYIVRTLALNSAGIKINISGAVSLSDEGFGGSLDGTVDNMPLNDLQRFWPVTLSPQSREWVTTRIRDGVIPHTTAHFQFTPADLSAPTLHDGVVTTDFEIENAVVTYMDNLPPVRDVNAKMHITGETMTAQITKGVSLTNTVIQKATVFIPDFNDYTTPVHLSSQLSTVAPDVAIFLDSQHLNLAQSLTLDANMIQGEGNVSLDMGLIIYPDEAGPVQDNGTIANYVIDAKLLNVSQPKVMGKWDISALGGSLHADNTTIMLEADTFLQDVQGKLLIQQNSTDSTSEYSWEADMPTNKLADFGLNGLPQGTNGTLGVKARLRENPTESSVEAKLDLTHVNIVIPALGYRKPNGRKAMLDIDYSLPIHSNATLNAEFQSDDEQVKGSAVLAAGDHSILQASLPKLQWNGSDLSLSYQKKPTGLQIISAKGRQLNLAPLMQNSASSADASRSDHLLEQLDLTLDIQNVSVGEGRALKGVKGHMLCPTDHCISASLEALDSKNKPFNYNISKSKGARKLSMQTDNAGEILRILEIAKHIRGGQLRVEGEFDDSKTDHPLHANVTMTEFSLENAPSLTKILSLLSLSGLADTLTGKGIYFTKLTGEVIHHHDDLIITEAKAYGSALGVTLEGEIANGGNDLALTGTLVPSYSANSMLGDLPLIGEALIGKQGEGVFAARFSVKGATDDPSVSVNPLSLLTPGFLRNLFEIAESPDANRVAKPATTTPVPSPTNAP